MPTKRRCVRWDVWQTQADKLISMSDSSTAMTLIPIKFQLYKVSERGWIAKDDVDGVPQDITFETLEGSSEESIWVSLSLMKTDRSEHELLLNKVLSKLVVPKYDQQAIIARIFEVVDQVAVPVLPLHVLILESVLFLELRTTILHVGDRHPESEGSTSTDDHHHSIKTHDGEPSTMTRQLDHSSEPKSELGHTMCAICLEHFDNNVGQPAAAATAPSLVTRLPCSHIYHTHCLFKWLMKITYGTCPFCRYSLSVASTRSILKWPTLKWLRPGPKAFLLCVGIVAYHYLCVQAFS